MGAKKLAEFQKHVHSSYGEGLSLRFAINKNRHLCLGREFTSITDCWSLQWILNYTGNNPAIKRLQMELMLWAFTLIHRSNHMVIDADYFSRLNTDLHIDPLLAQYDELAQIMYKRYTPPTGDINPETLPGFRQKRSRATSNLINVKSSDISQIRNIPVNFGTDDFTECNSPS